MFTPNSQSGDGSVLPRTSPRKAGVPTIDLDKVNTQERFSWDSDKTRHFLEVLLQEIEQECRTTLGFDSAAWNRIATNLSARIKEQVSKKQCTNKYDYLRKDWKAWDFLLNDCSLTGLGRDPNTGAITAPDHQWKQWCSHDTKVAKFRKKPLEHPELMERVFRKVTRTSKGVYTSGGDNSQFFEVVKLEESSMAEKGFGEDDVGLDPFETPQSDLGNPRLQSGSTSKGKKRKNSMVIEHKHETINSLISEGMKILNEMVAFKDPANLDLKLWVMALLESSPAKLAFFSNIQSNVERMHWLRRQHIQERLAFQRSGATLGGDEPPPGIFPPPPTWLNYDYCKPYGSGVPRSAVYGQSSHQSHASSSSTVNEIKRQVREATQEIEQRLTNEIEQRLTNEIEQRLAREMERMLNEKLTAHLKHMGAQMALFESYGETSRAKKVPNVTSGQPIIRQAMGDDIQNDNQAGSPLPACSPQLDYQDGQKACLVSHTIPKHYVAEGIIISKDPSVKVEASR